MNAKSTLTFFHGTCYRKILWDIDRSSLADHAFARSRDPTLPVAKKNPRTILCKTENIIFSSATFFRLNESTKNSGGRICWQQTSSIYFFPSLQTQFYTSPYDLALCSVAHISIERTCWGLHEVEVRGLSTFLGVFFGNLFGNYNETPLVSFRFISYKFSFDECTGNGTFSSNSFNPIKHFCCLINTAYSLKLFLFKTMTGYILFRSIRYVQIYVFNYVKIVYKFRKLKL